MFNLLRLIRYLVFVVFIISNAIVTAVAVWNLSIVQGNMLFSSTAAATASYLIAIAAMGLLLIFPIIFVEIAGKKIFLAMVWFELVWVGISGLMTLIGAALITNLSSRELCVPTATVSAEESLLATSAIQGSPCSSGQVLGVFTWMPAAFLLAYVSFLTIVAFVWSKEDPTVWKSLVRDLPLDKILGHVKRNSATVTLPHIKKSPVIHAPRPRYIIPPLLDCRSARNSAYDDPLPARSAPVREMKLTSTHLPSISQGPHTSTATAFYNPSVQKAMVSGGSRAPPRPPPVQLGNSRREQTSPPPLGDWPRLNATSQPRTKRYRAVPQARAHPAGETPDAHRHPSRQTAPASAPSGRTAVLPRTLPTRPKPPGSGSLDSGSGSASSHRPPPLDLSQISAHRTRSQRSRARAGR